MNEEKIDQNVERLDNFLFHILGCSKKDVVEIMSRFTERKIINPGVHKVDKPNMEQVERWAEYVKSVPREVWKVEQTEFINSVFEKT